MTCLFVVSLASVNKKRFSIFEDFWLINFSLTCHAFNILSRIENYPDIAKIFSSSLSFCILYLYLWPFWSYMLGIIWCEDWCLFFPLWISIWFSTVSFKKKFFFPLNCIGNVAKEQLNIQTLFTKLLGSDSSSSNFHYIWIRLAWYFFLQCFIEFTGKFI